MARRPQQEYFGKSVIEVRSAVFWNWMIGLGVLMLAVLTMYVLKPMFYRQLDGRGYDVVQAISNARQIGLALFEFENDYHSYPDAATEAAVRKATGSTLTLGTVSSNDYFRQLLAGNFTQSERMFYARIPGANRPDDNIADQEALKKGECGFSYLVGLSSEGNPGRPIAVTPLIPGTDRFDPKTFEGKAIILRLDNSASQISIDKSGHAMLDGVNILDPKHPIWGGHPYSKIAYPE